MIREQRGRNHPENQPSSLARTAREGGQESGGGPLPPPHPCSPGTPQPDAPTSPSEVPQPPLHKSPFLSSMQLPPSSRAHRRCDHLIRHRAWFSHVSATMLLASDAWIANFNTHTRIRKAGERALVKSADSGAPFLEIQSVLRARESAFITNHSGNSPVKKHSLSSQHPITG